MDVAIQQAGRTLPLFTAEYGGGTAAASRFSVKKRFTDGKTGEYMWLNVTSFDGNQFAGVLDNDPEEVKGFRIGETYTVQKDEVADWMITDKTTNRIRGAYTLRVLLPTSPPDEQKFLKALLVPLPPDLKP